MMLDKPGDRVRLGLRKAQAGTELARDARAHFGMVFLPALADVVQQLRHVENTPRLHVPDDLGGERMVLLQRPGLDPRQQADGADQMLVHRVVVVHVELHHRHHATEGGQEAAEHPCLAHAAQDTLHTGAGRQQAQEDAVSLGVGPEAVVDQMQGLADQAPGIRVERHAMLLGELEQADQVQRIAVERFPVGNRHAAVLDAEICAAAQLGTRTPGERGEQAAAQRRSLQLLHLERGAGDQRQLAHLLGSEEVVTHESLDALEAPVLLVAEHLGEHGLQVEGQPLLRPAGHEVDMAAHRPQHPLALAIEPELRGREHRQLGGPGLIARLRKAQIARQPVQRMQVAQAPFAILDIGLHPVAGLSGALVPLVALGELGLEEGACVRSAHDLLPEPPLELGKELGAAQDEPRIEKRGADRHVGLGQGHALVDGAHGMTDLQPHVPKHIEHELGDALTPGGLLVRQHEQDIDIGRGRQHASAVAAGRGDAEAFRGREIGRRIDVAGGEGIEEPDQRVLELRQAARAAHPIAVGFEGCARCATGIREQRLQALHDQGPELLDGSCVGIAQACELALERIGVEVGRWQESRGVVHGMGRIDGRPDPSLFAVAVARDSFIRFNSAWNRPRQAARASGQRHA